jgi:hypothetical protein
VRKANSFKRSAFTVHRSAFGGRSQGGGALQAKYINNVPVQRRI